ncbi:hypothetical protein EO95_06675 [Methanosarcina sp. 1.H.T.1A.1]|uniref:hypothetical protein n=1 Tax=unclassified Methanosarcina TaxID=2644672 RepID=UPI00062233FB|nr:MULTISPECIES: hypothetical protein [unclassified Methanosarcina]KKH50598.1 hypothetical protein EO93_08030 [Methanosarcina sp. 1.H.A.2.2]KKH97035.1 hypothetical protein EO95_06675 [Methanosarcina sp. 1.H.T.1A.1]
MLLTEEILLLEPGLEAVRAREEARLFRVIDELGELGMRFFSGRLSQGVTGETIACIKSLGMAAAEENMTDGVLNAAASLGLIGQEAARNGANEAVLETALALKALGEKTADMETIFSLRLIAISLKEVGKEAVRQGMEKEAIKSQFCLKELHNSCIGSENEFETFNEDFFSLIRDIGRCAADAGLEKAAINAAALMEDF